MMGPQKRISSDSNETSLPASGGASRGGIENITSSYQSDALNALNASYGGSARPMSPTMRLKSKTELGIRQFGDVIGRARSTLNVIDIWKSKLVSASSSVASAAARQLPSSGSGERGFGFGSKNKTKSTIGNMVMATSPVLAGLAAGSAGALAGKSEISPVSSTAAASRIKRRLFKRNKSLDFDSVPVTAASVEAIHSPATKPINNSDTSGVLSRSVDNILAAIAGCRDTTVICADEVVRVGQVTNAVRRRSSASTLFPDSDRQRSNVKARRRRTASENEDSLPGVKGALVNSNKQPRQLETTKTSSEEDYGDDDEEYLPSDKFGRENVLNNKLAERSYSVRENSKRSLGTRRYRRGDDTLAYSVGGGQRASSHGYPILLLDGDFDLDDFYYYYWKKKLGGGRDELYDADEASVHGVARKAKKVIRAKLKLKKVPPQLRDDEDRLLGRRLSDPTLNTASTIVEEVQQYTTEDNMLTDDSSATTTTTSTATTISALGIPKPRKKLSFKEPERSRGRMGDVVHSYFRPRSGSLDSELEVLLGTCGISLKVENMGVVCTCSSSSLIGFLVIIEILGHSILILS